MRCKRSCDRAIEVTRRAAVKIASHQDVHFGVRLAPLVLSGPAHVGALGAPTLTAAQLKAKAAAEADADEE
jgi:hypothetical protein